MKISKVLWEDLNTFDIVVPSDLLVECNVLVQWPPRDAQTHALSPEVMIKYNQVINV